MLVVSMSRRKSVFACLLLGNICTPYTGAKADECSGRPRNACEVLNRIQCVDCRWDDTVNRCVEYSFRCLTPALRTSISKKGLDIPYKASESDVKNKIKAFEAARGLKSTGKLEGETLKALREP